MMYYFSNDHSSVSHGIKTTISYVASITALTVSTHKTTNGINTLIKPVSAAEYMTPGSFR